MSAGAQAARLARAWSERRARGLVAGLAAEVPLCVARPARVSSTLLAREPELEASVRAFLERSGPQATGAGLEAKVRAVRCSVRDEQVEIAFAPTTWELGRAFHLALLSSPELPPFAQHWLESALEGQPLTPGLGAVHGLIVTSDGALVLMRRAAGVLYRPLHWAATFEEQMIAEDCRGDDALDAAIRRGVREELGLDTARARVEFLMPLVELETLNFACLSLVRAAETAREVRERAARAVDAVDVASLDFVAAEPGRLRELAARGGAPAHTPLHPTSELRLLALARHLESARP